MKNQNTPAAWLTAAVFGVLAGIGGLTHAVGEILQGSVPAGGIWINSWTVGPIAQYMGGEPGLTLIPNMLVTGVVNFAVSLAVIAWAALYVRRPRGGLVLILLSLAMLLVGGGVGPPVIGILAGVAGLGIGSPLDGWRRRLSPGLRRALAALWPWVFALAAANGVFLVLGSLVLVFFFAYNNPDLFTNSFFLSVLLLLVLIPLGRAYDVHQDARGPAAALVS